MHFLSALTIVAALVTAGCVTQPIEQKSALELQAIQVKEFETNQRTAFTAVMSVFQDLGYIVNSASLETGFITAKSPAKTEMVIFSGYIITDEKANAFIEQIAPNRTKVRLTFVRTEQKSTGFGKVGERDIPITDPAPYQSAFAKIQQSIFIRSNVN
ncbi:hypothetical protein [Hydrogenophaga sp.]|uniref:hypothetical protein n=1 Tax=Hydrogenophaga sp. TaxID=1904254 RepID=UPI00271CB56F|nr:hypothetical protein [Hydrogenophaga sp.]MDO8904985.1 hypothetical protein [Hydrogenophaga sp.]